MEDPAIIDRHASEAGVDLVSMHTALADGSAVAALAEAETVGHKYGVRGTPAWLLGQQLIEGLQPASEFEQLAENAMAANSSASEKRMGDG